MEQTRPFFYKGLISFVKKVGNGNEIPAVKRDKKRRDAEFSAKLLILPKIETMEQQQTDEKFMRLALNEAEKALEEQEVPIGGGRGRPYRRPGAQPGRNFGGRYGPRGNAGPDGGGFDRRRQVSVRMYVVCNGRALHYVCRGDCVEPDRACGLWRRRSEEGLSPLFGTGVSAPNDSDAGGACRGVRADHNFVFRRIEKVIFGKCRKKTKFANFVF